MAERIVLTTVDDVKIIGDWTAAPTTVGAVLLLHMMPDTRGSWSDFARALVKRGIASLAIDLRGHGESTATTDGDTIDFREFTDEDHQISMFDVREALSWLRTRGLERERIAVGGASFGANLALRLLTEEPRLPGAMLLSPGADYHGVKALEDAQNLGPYQALFIGASEDDSESFTCGSTLYADAPVENKTFVPYKTGGHGMRLFTSDPALIDKAADWFEKIIKGG